MNKSRANPFEIVDTRRFWNFTIVLTPFAETPIVQFNCFTNGYRHHTRIASKGFEFLAYLNFTVWKWHMRHDSVWFCRVCNFFLHFSLFYVNLNFIFWFFFVAHESCCAAECDTSLITHIMSFFLLLHRIWVIRNHSFVIYLLLWDCGFRLKSHTL